MYYYIAGGASIAVTIMSFALGVFRKNYSGVIFSTPWMVLLTYHIWTSVTDAEQSSPLCSSDIRCFGVMISVDALMILTVYRLVKLAQFGAREHRYCTWGVFGGILLLLLFEGSVSTSTSTWHTLDRVGSGMVALVVTIGSVYAASCACTIYRQRSVSGSRYLRMGVIACGVCAVMACAWLEFTRRVVASPHMGESTSKSEIWSRGVSLWLYFAIQLALVAVNMVEEISINNFTPLVSIMPMDANSASHAIGIHTKAHPPDLRDVVRRLGTDKHSGLNSVEDGEDVEMATASPARLLQRVQNITANEDMVYAMYIHQKNSCRHLGEAVSRLESGQRTGGDMLTLAESAVRHSSVEIEPYVSRHLTHSLASFSKISSADISLSTFRPLVDLKIMESPLTPMDLLCVIAFIEKGPNEFTIASVEPQSTSPLARPVFMTNMHKLLRALITLVTTKEIQPTGPAVRQILQTFHQTNLRHLETCAYDLTLHFCLDMDRSHVSLTNAPDRTVVYPSFALATRYITFMNLERNSAWQQMIVDSRGMTLSHLWDRLLKTRRDDKSTFGRWVRRAPPGGRSSRPTELLDVLIHETKFWNEFPRRTLPEKWVPTPRGDSKNSRTQASSSGGSHEFPKDPIWFTGENWTAFCPSSRKFITQATTLSQLICNGKCSLSDCLSAITTLGECAISTGNPRGWSLLLPLSLLNRRGHQGVSSGKMCIWSSPDSSSKVDRVPLSLIVRWVLASECASSVGWNPLHFTNPNYKIVTRLETKGCSPQMIMGVAQILGAVLFLAELQAGDRKTKPLAPSFTQVEVRLNYFLWHDPAGKPLRDAWTLILRQRKRNLESMVAAKTSPPDSVLAKTHGGTSLEMFRELVVHPGCGGVGVFWDTKFPSPEFSRCLLQWWSCFENRTFSLRAALLDRSKKTIQELTGRALERKIDPLASLVAFRDHLGYWVQAYVGNMSLDFLLDSTPECRSTSGFFRV